MALDREQAAIVLHAIRRSHADYSSVVHDNAGESARVSFAGFDDDVSGHGVTYGDLLELAVVEQGIIKDRSAANFPGSRSQYDGLVRRLRENYGYRRRILRPGWEWTCKIPGGEADVLKRRLEP